MGKTISTSAFASGVAGVDQSSGNGFGVQGISYSTGAGSGVNGTVIGSANTGYAGFFANTGTGAINYGIYATTSSATGWAGYFQGNIYLSGTITLASDRSLKDNIEILNTKAALDNITALQPVAFKWKKSGKPDMGLIAQDVRLVFPQLVTPGNDNTLSVEYVSLIAPLIASVQELKKRNALQAENTSLRRDFNAYKASHP